MLDTEFFLEIGRMVLDKKILRVFNIYGHGGHLGQVASIRSLKLYFPCT